MIIFDVVKKGARSSARVMLVMLVCMSMLSSVVTHGAAGEVFGGEGSLVRCKEQLQDARAKVRDQDLAIASLEEENNELRLQVAALVEEVKPKARTSMKAAKAAGVPEVVQEQEAAVELQADEVAKYRAQWQNAREQLQNARAKIHEQGVKMRGLEQEITKLNVQNVELGQQLGVARRFQDAASRQEIREKDAQIGRLLGEIEALKRERVSE